MVSSDSDTVAGFMLLAGKSLLFSCINKRRGEIADNYWHLMGFYCCQGYRLMCVWLNVCTELHKM